MPCRVQVPTVRPNRLEATAAADSRGGVVTWWETSRPWRMGGQGLPFRVMVSTQKRTSRVRVTVRSGVAVG